MTSLRGLARVAGRAEEERPTPEKRCAEVTQRGVAAGAQRGVLPAPRGGGARQGRRRREMRRSSPECLPGALLGLTVRRGLGHTHEQLGCKVVEGGGSSSPKGSDSAVLNAIQRGAF